MDSSSSIAAERRQRIQATLADIRRILADEPPSRDSLARVKARLEQLAAEPRLFSATDFPPPPASEGVGATTRYRLNPDDGDDDLALYLNSLNPGRVSVPHNHTTWAVIVAVEGDELNRIYSRADDGSDPGRAKLEMEREVVVQPGTSIAFLPDDIHSIHVTGQTPTRHFHLYGRPLETLANRVGFNPETGEILNYNKTQMRPSTPVRA
jgi:predicted metal-dependent enzyme (double-stranded beta helix superfamily)